MTKRKYNLMPTWKQFWGWSMPSKHGFLGLILDLFSILFTIIFGLVAFGEGKVNENHVTNQNIYISSPSNISSDEPEYLNTFTFEGFSSNKLKDEIEKLGRLKFSPNSLNKIRIYSSGETLPLSRNNNTYVFNGGHLILQVGGVCSHSLDNMIIPQMRPNSKHVIENEIEKSITRYIDGNTSFFIKLIDQCSEN